ncbi:MAG: HEAT repeat domain-containing protein [Longimicrobiales bacterium]|nr:HEAT repeat domain-containing protein [Longimicrobiales bacterium]
MRGNATGVVVAGVLLALGWGSGGAAQTTGTGVPGSGDAARAMSELATAAPQDPGDEMWREARRALNREAYQEAARLFMDLRRRHPRSTYVGDSYYFEALARYRDASGGSLQQAQRLLGEQRELFPDAATARDAAALAARITADAARRGDPEARVAVRRQARQSCEEEGGGVRAAALSALLQMEPDRALPILEELLRDRGACAAQLRRQAVFLLSQADSERAVDLLLELAHTNPDPDPEVREAAVFWLSQSSSPRARQALVAILESGDAPPQIQERALFALGQTDTPESRAVLERYARDGASPAELREAAIFWLGQTPGGSGALREIYGTLTDPDLKERALFGIGEAGGAADREWLLERALDTSESTEVRRAALFWAGQSGVEPSRVVRIYRGTDDVELKEHALFVLSQTSSADQAAAVDAMMDIAQTETDPKLRERAVFWLGQTDDPRVPEFLLRLVRGG